MFYGDFTKLLKQIAHLHGGGPLFWNVTKLYENVNSMFVLQPCFANSTYSLKTTPGPTSQEEPHAQQSNVASGGICQGRVPKWHRKQLEILICNAILRVFDRKCFMVAVPEMGWYRHPTWVVNDFHV